MAKLVWIPRSLCGVLGVLLLTVSFAEAQMTLQASAASTATPETVEDVLHQMSDRADVIFAGEVMAIRPHEDGAAGAGFVEIDFQVDQAIRGCTAGEIYVLREWAGLWTGEAHRYEAGERLLMMLRAPGASGLSSPVGGMNGAIPIRGGAGVSLSAAGSTLSSSPTADLRWLGAQLLHPVAYTIHSAYMATPLTMSQQMASASPSDSSSELVAEPIAVEDRSAAHGSVPLQQAPVGTLVKLLSTC